MLGKLTTGITDLMASLGKKLPTVIKIFDPLEMIFVHVGRIRSTSCQSSSKPILIVIWTMDHLQATLTVQLWNTELGIQGYHV